MNRRHFLKSAVLAVVSAPMVGSAVAKPQQVAVIVEKIPVTYTVSWRHVGGHGCLCTPNLDDAKRYMNRLISEDKAPGWKYSDINLSSSDNSVTWNYK